MKTIKRSYGGGLSQRRCGMANEKWRYGKACRKRNLNDDMWRVSMTMSRRNIKRYAPANNRLNNV